MKTVAGRRWCWGLGLTLAVGLTIFASNAGKMLVIDAPAHSDIMVVLAGETDRRPAHALELLRQGYAQRVLLDVPAAARIYDTSALQLAAKYIRELPEAGQIGLCPIRGLSTRDEAHDAEKCLAGESGSRILIVTSDYHTRRSLSVFQHEIRGKFFTVAAARDDTQFGTQWWKHRQWAKTCLDEWLRMLWWSGIERWR